MSVADRIRDVPKRVQDDLIRFADVVIPYVQDEFKRTLNVQGSNRDRSKPGEPPRKQTGNLMRRAYARYYINTSPVWELSIKFGSEAEYFGYLQRGTPRMARRPSIEPTIERIRPQLMRLRQQSKGV